MKLIFHGGAKSVTGANYLLDFGSKKILIDCGLFQGSKYAEGLNYEKFPYNPAEIDSVFITHSHIDHVGRLPKLWKEGFRGTIYATEPTVGIMHAALPDNLSHIKNEAKRDKHEALFNLEDLNNTIALVKGVKYYEKIVLSDDLYVIFHNAGHILGSSIIEVGFSGKKVYFSGDLGNPPMPLLPAPDTFDDADYVVMESVYGSRVHEDKKERKNILEDTIEDTVSRGGVLMIPSFAVERTQELLFELNELVHNRRIPQIPMFIDSPLAIKMTDVYKKFSNYLSRETLEIMKIDKDIFDFPGLTMTKRTEDSKKINDISPPKIIIAGSGMSTGGRILHHESRYLGGPNNTILFIGYQAEGSLGRRILEGSKGNKPFEVKIFGKKIPVNCQVKAIGGYSAHADQPQILKWIKKANKSKKLKNVFIVQGEEESANALATKLKDKLLINATVPSQGDEVDI